MKTEESQALVIGGGVAGLTAAFRLRQAGVDVTVLEATDKCGGPMRSVLQDGHLFELGPNTVPSTAPHLGRLIDDLGLRPRVRLSRPVAGRRLVWRHGRLHALPEKPPELLTCSALGPLAKMRLALEPLIPRRRGGEPETLLELGRRRLGRGATAAFLDPFITGVFAGRLDRLGVDALPRLAALEQQHGSLFRAAVAARRERRQPADPSADPSAKQTSGPAPLVSFPEGLEALPTALVEALDGRVEAGWRAVRISPVDEGYAVDVEGPDEGRRRFHTRALVVATPGPTMAELLRPLLPAPQAEHFSALEHPFVATVSLGYRRQDVEHSLDAFGLLVASDSRLEPDADVLGVLFPSSIFDDRAPEGGVTVTVMIGGARDPAAASLSDDGLVERARRGVATLIGARGEPVSSAVARWPRAIPQYPPGHASCVRQLRHHLKHDHHAADAGPVAGVAVAGNYLDGVGVEGAVASGDLAAEALLDPGGPNNPR